MRIKCLAQEHNAVPQPGLEPGPSDPESSTLTIRPHASHNKAHTHDREENAQAPFLINFSR